MGTLVVRGRAYGDLWHTEHQVFRLSPVGRWDETQVEGGARGYIAALAHEGHGAMITIKAVVLAGLR